MNKSSAKNTPIIIALTLVVGFNIIMVLNVLSAEDEIQLWKKICGGIGSLILLLLTVFLIYKMKKKNS